MSAKVATKIIEVMKRVGYLQKDGNVNFKSTNYNYLSEEKVTQTISKARIEVGLVILPVKTEQTVEGNRTQVVVTYQFIDTESGETLEAQMIGHGADTQDKGASKALTQAFKYLQRQTFGIATGDDPDHVSSAQLEQEQKDREALEMKRREEEREKIVEEARLTYKELKGDLEGYEDLFNRLKKEGSNERQILAFLQAKLAERQTASK